MIQFLYKKSFLTTKIIAVTNVLVLGSVGYLSIFMFNNTIELLEVYFGWVLIFSTVVSVLLKLYKKVKFIWIQILLDFILIVGVYNPLSYSSLFDFYVSFFDYNVHCVIFLFVYLLYYDYCMILRRRAHFL